MPSKCLPCQLPHPDPSIAARKLPGATIASPSPSPFHDVPSPPHSPRFTKHISSAEDGRALLRVCSDPGHECDRQGMAGKILPSVERPGWGEGSWRLHKSFPKGRPICLILGPSVPCDLGLRARVLRAGKAGPEQLSDLLKIAEPRYLQLWNSLVTGLGQRHGPQHLGGWVSSTFFLSSPLEFGPP